MNETNSQGSSAPVRSDAREGRSSQLTTVSLLLVVGIGALFLSATRHHEWFLDLDAYLRAVLDVAAGLDPYRHDVHVLFIYHPAVLDALRALDAIPLLSLKAVLLIGYACSLTAVATGFWRADRQAAASILVFSLAFGAAGFFSVTTGNMTAFMHLALLAALLRAEDRGSRAFFVFAGLLSLFIVVKPYFAAYALIPPLLLGKSRKSIGLAVAPLLPAGLVYGGYALFAPEETLAFWQALHHQTIGKQNYGISVFALVLRVVHRSGPSFAVHFALTGFVLALAIRIARAERAARGSLYPGVLILYAALTWINPRMMIYDLYPSLLCLFGISAHRVPRYLAAATVATLLSVVPLFAANLEPITASLRRVFPPLVALLRSEALWQVVGCLVLAGALFAARRVAPSESRTEVRTHGAL